MLTCLVRLVAAGQTAELHQGAVAFRLFSSMRPDDMHGTNKKAGAWDQVSSSGLTALQARAWWASIALIGSRPFSMLECIRACIPGTLVQK